MQFGAYALTDGSGSLLPLSAVFIVAAATIVIHFLEVDFERREIRAYAICALATWSDTNGTAL